MFLLNTWLESHLKELLNAKTTKHYHSNYLLYFVNKQHTCNLIVKQGWKIPVDEDSVSYDTMDSWTDASFSKTLRNRTTALAVKSNANGTISWTINLDKAGAPAGSVITEVGKFKNVLQNLKK